MSPSASRWLIVSLALVLLVNNLQASILHQSAALMPNQPKKYHQTEAPNRDSIIPITDTNDTSSDSQLSATKFIILTTGDQIKLYPLVPNTGMGQNNPELLPTYGHYLIKPKKASRNKDTFLPVKSGKNSLRQLLLPSKDKAYKTYDQDLDQRPLDTTMNVTKLGLRTDRIRSILPSSDWQDNSDYLSDDPDKVVWKEPLIVDVDYFFDPEFCYPRVKNIVKNMGPSDCLVVVWLDKNNKVVRYGSINLATNPIELSLSSGSSSHRNKVIWLHEFDPIRVIDSVAASTDSSFDGQVFGMVVDKRRAKLHVAFSQDSKPYANRILSGTFKSRIKHMMTRASSSSSAATRDRLYGETILKFNDCESNNPSIQVNRSFENLSLDEDNGDWLFYFDQYQGGKIFALNVNSRWTSTIAKIENIGDNNQSLAFTDYSIQALVRDIRLGAWKEHGVEVNRASDATGMAMDSGQRRLYWMDEANEIHSCDYAGYNATLIGRLSPKPVIRSPHSMQVFKDTLYVSDPIKKSLIAYKLAKKGSLAQASSGKESKFHSSDSVRVRNDKSRKQPLDTIYPTHQVLLVEMPTLYGFRLVDIEKSGNTIESNEFGDIRLDRIRDGGGLVSNHKRFEITSEGGEQQSYLERRGYNQLSGSAKTEPDYGHLLLDRIYPNPLFGCDSPNLERRTSSQNDRLFFFLLELGLLNIAFVALWTLFPRLQLMIFKAREDRLISDTILISKKCQV